MITNLQITFAPEILGSKCEDCGSVLERTSAGRWCDFCCEFKGDNKVSLDELLLELDRLSLEGSLVKNSAARDLIEDYYTSALNDGYDEGFSDGENNCGDDEW